MKKEPPIAMLLFALSFSAAFALVDSGSASAVDQPIVYNHYKHTQELELECTICHVGVRTEIRATLPSTETCIGCHEEPVTESAEEEKIRQYYARKEDIPWQRLFQVPEHVFFSHRRHVTVAGLDCAKCHGDMATRKKPPKKAPMAISMKACMSCHRKLQAQIDCVSCHH
jgi:hypothetical protein